MIPQRVHHDDLARADEPEEIRKMTKKALHARLSNDYFLPDHTTRGVNRIYLVGVFTGVFYRVLLLDFKRFDAELTPAHKKRSPILCGADAVSKINRLLQETNQHQLGFPAGLYPDESWFLNIARFIDRTSVTGIFLEPLPNEQPPNCISARMVTAKRAAEEFLMGERELLANTTVFNQVKEVWESQKRLVAKRMEFDSLVTHGRSVEERLREEEMYLSSKLMTTAMSIFAFGYGIENPAEQIFNEERGAPFRDQIAQIQEM